MITHLISCFMSYLVISHPLIFACKAASGWFMWGCNILQFGCYCIFLSCIFCMSSTTLPLIASVCAFVFINTENIYTWDTPCTLRRAHNLMFCFVFEYCSQLVRHCLCICTCTHDVLSILSLLFLLLFLLSEVASKILLSCCVAPHYNDNKVSCILDLFPFDWRVRTLRVKLLSWNLSLEDSIFLFNTIHQTKGNALTVSSCWTAFISWTVSLSGYFQWTKKLKKCMQNSH